MSETMNLVKMKNPRRHLRQNKNLRRRYMMSNQKYPKVRNAHITIFPSDGQMEFKDGEYEEAINRIDKNKLKYLIYQGEISPTTGRQHIQAYIQLKTQSRYSTIKKIFKDDRIHITPQTYGTDEACIDYCKDTTKQVFREPQEYGETKQQGKRSDLDTFKERLDQGEKPIDIAGESPQMLQLYIQYKNGLNEYSRKVNEKLYKEELNKKYEHETLRKFQEEIMNIVNAEKQQEEERKIHWFFEEQGNTGKSWLTKRLIANSNAIMFNTGKQQDILYAYDNQPVVIFDLPRISEHNENIYTTIELLKNGNYLSTKYESHSVLTKPPTIIIFSNFKPLVKTLSRDRWNIHEIQKDYTTKSIRYEELYKEQERFIGYENY